MFQNVLQHDIDTLKCAVAGNDIFLFTLYYAQLWVSLGRWFMILLAKTEICCNLLAYGN